VFDEGYISEENCSREWCDEWEAPNQFCHECYMRTDLRLKKYPRTQYRITNWMTTIENTLSKIGTKDELKKMSFSYCWMGNILTVRTPDDRIYGKFALLSRERNVIQKIQEYLK
jgi:hypothetical protein